MSNASDFFQGGGGSEFVASRSYPIERITAGATGTFKTLIPPTGKRIKITNLVALGTSTNLFTLTVGGVDVVNDVVLIGGLGSIPNHFAIANATNFILGNIDEPIEFKTNVATSHDIVFTYQEGN